MNKYARIESGIAVEVFTAPDAVAITDCFHPEIAALFSPCPDDVTASSTVDASGVWMIAPVADPLPAVAPAAEAPKVSPVEFKLLFTSGERVAINAILAAKTDPVLSDFYSILDDPRLTGVDMALESNRNAVGYALTVAGAAQTPPYTEEVIAARRSEILSGVLK